MKREEKIYAITAINSDSAASRLIYILIGSGKRAERGHILRVWREHLPPLHGFA